MGEVFEKFCGISVVIGRPPGLYIVNIMLSVFDDDFVEKFISCAVDDFIKSVDWNSEKNDNYSPIKDCNFPSLDTIETNLH